MKKIVGKILQFFFGFFPIQENKILFETCNGEVKDHLKAIYDYFNQNGINDYCIKWVITRGNDVSHIKKSEIVYRKTIGYYYHLLTSKYWMRTHSVSNIVDKRKGQVYIQLWHNQGAIKREGFDLNGIPNNGEPIFHAKEWDYFIATDEINQSYIKVATNIKIPRILLGSCRTDAIVEAGKECSKNIREQLGVLPEEKVILYAPTFREHDFQSQKVDLKIKDLCKQEGIRVILRLHPEVKNKIRMEDYDSSVIDGNQFPDIVDLYLAADILITDYSTVCMEFALLNKPILYYMYDLEEYQKERGFCCDYLEHLAGPMVRTEVDLICAVHRIEDIVEEYKEKYHSYQERYNKYNDGHVCERFYGLLKNGFFLEKSSREG